MAYVCMYVCMYVYIYIYRERDICVYVCIYIYIYIYMAARPRRGGLPRARGRFSRARASLPERKKGGLEKGVKKQTRIPFFSLNGWGLWNVIPPFFNLPFSILASFLPDPGAFDSSKRTVPETNVGCAMV